MYTEQEGGRETITSTQRMCLPYLLLPCLGLRCLSRWFLRSPGPEDEAEDEPDPPGPVDDTSWLIISHMSYCSDSMSLELSLSKPWARSSSSMNPLLHRGQTYSCKERVLLHIQQVLEYFKIHMQLSISAHFKTSNTKPQWLISYNHYLFPLLTQYFQTH